MEARAVFGRKCIAVRGTMSEAVNGKELWDEAYVRSLIESQGGVQKILDEMREHKEIWKRMQAEHAALMEKYPDKWVAMGMEGLLAVGDSMDEVIEAVESQEIREEDTVIEFLDTDPPIYIL